MSGSTRVEASRAWRGGDVPRTGDQGPGMGVPWRDHPAWAVVYRAEAALGEPLARSPGRVGRGARPAPGSRSWPCSSPPSWPGRRCARRSRAPGRLRRALPGPDHRPHRRRRAQPGGRRPARRPPGRGHPGRRRPAPGPDGRPHGRRRGQATRCAAGPDECWLANDNAPGQIVVAGTPSRDRAGHQGGQASRRPPGHPPAGGWRLPHPAHGRGGRARWPTSWPTVALPPPSAPVFSNADARPYDDGEGWRTRLADHLVSPVRWRPVDADARRPTLGATAFVEVGHGSTAGGAGQAVHARRARSRCRHPRRRRPLLTEVV